jgi:hypothetical protein
MLERIAERRTCCGGRDQSGDDCDGGAGAHAHESSWASFAGKMGRPAHTKPLLRLDNRGSP